MPSNGQPSFLPGSWYEKPDSFRCQCPLTGNHHFYGALLPGDRFLQRHVSMPSNGQPSFLRTYANDASGRTVEVSMPSNGQPSFLRSRRPSRGLTGSSCQCPLTGNHHFYRRTPCITLQHSKWVSMPSNGQPSFLRCSPSRR